jgi:hypothetical protein
LTLGLANGGVALLEAEGWDHLKDEKAKEST